ncbi:MAG: tryptophan--tRNA ligase [Patescibacteria group bacterium]
MSLVVSGIKPSGELHIGNYLGAVKQFLELQGKYDCFFFIADLHSLTEDFTPEQKRIQIRDIVINLLALGLDPKKCTLFIQSHVPECLELAWIFNCLTPVSFLERMTQYKDFKVRQKAGANAGLLTYPVLQAADVLLYRGTLVPVGKDQIQHLELTNDIVGFFNNRFGEYFERVKPLMTEAPKVISITEPEKKMSKSLGPKTYIALRDEPQIILEKIKRAPTGMGNERTIPPGAQNLLELLRHFAAGSDFRRFSTEAKDGTIRYSELKETLARSIADFFSDFRTRRMALEKEDSKINKILETGAKKAKTVATKTLREVKDRVGLI